ncbi:hypothetical protein [Paenibacillus apiarius]|uniref:hypothetical protein n=1 Tax=Paenibacillus apiarius TaxID=46240 RepID=UPI001981F4A6|nr:hypothetical protein [Paenibacillus apiarius]MBN3523750.1 hypothetical protein [Paenibacillus apiarius]
MKVIMKRFMLLLPSLSDIASAKTPLKEGMVIGKIASQQLKGKINGIPIQGYTFRNSFWVAVKDLNHYGFDVAINNDSKYDTHLPKHK